MKTNVNGLTLEVTGEDRAARVRITMSDVDIMDTSRLSPQGLENLAEAIQIAIPHARQLVTASYEKWVREQEAELRRSRTADRSL